MLSSLPPLIGFFECIVRNQQCISATGQLRLYSAALCRLLACHRSLMRSIAISSRSLTIHLMVFRHSNNPARRLLQFSMSDSFCLSSLLSSTLHHFVPISGIRTKLFYVILPCRQLGHPQRCKMLSCCQCNIL